MEHILPTEEEFPSVSGGIGSYGVLPDGSYGVRSSPEDLLPGCEGNQNSDVISLDEVRKHCTEDSLWVVYGGEVFDVTGFIREHPGGATAILSAGGQVHFNLPTPHLSL